jgi:hypothetical protein
MRLLAIRPPLSNGRLELSCSADQLSTCRQARLMTVPALLNMLFGVLTEKAPVEQPGLVLRLETEVRIRVPGRAARTPRPLVGRTRGGPACACRKFGVSAGRSERHVNASGVACVAPRGFDATSGASVNARRSRLVRRRGRIRGADRRVGRDGGGARAAVGSATPVR